MKYIFAGLSIFALSALPGHASALTPDDIKRCQALGPELNKRVAAMNAEYKRMQVLADETEVAGDAYVAAKEESLISPKANAALPALKADYDARKAEVAAANDAFLMRQTSVQQDVNFFNNTCTKKS